MHKNKYDHNILLNDIQKLDKIQHKHSLVAIRFPDTSAEKKCKFRFIGSPIPLATDQCFRS